MKKKKNWVDYMWILSSLYLILGLFNILFAWLGLLCFLIPLILSVVSGKKTYCNVYCGRGQLFYLLGKKYKLSRNKDIPKFLRSKWFRYGFLTFFMIMFFQMLMVTFYVFTQAQDLKAALTLFWTWKLPWNSVFAVGHVPAWVTQFAYGFYSMMLTSTLLGMITMILYRPRSWCVYCPMGTMTQGICQIKLHLQDNSKKLK